MIEPPKQRWAWYEEKCRSEHTAWLRSLSPAASFALCEDLYRLARRAQDGASAAERMEQERWQEKLALRKRVVAALTELDRRRRE